MANLDHVAHLRRLGYDAALLIVRPPETPPFVPSFPQGLDVPWQTGLGGIGRDDVLVVGEMFGAGALAVQSLPARKILHNQGPFYTFAAFIDLPSMIGWGAEAMILPSAFAADMVARMGWTRPLHVVRPPLDPVFAAAGGARQLRVLGIPNRRPQEWRLIRGILRSQRPDLADVPWVELRGLTRPEVARAMAASEIFLATGHLDGLGLPPLEAMATGALVVGFRGGGGAEYATPENGDWFEEGAHFEIAETLAARIDALRAGERFETRREAGRRSAAAFSRETFEAQLETAWCEIAGPPG